MTQPLLTFDEPTAAPDICANRHRGNTESRAANVRTDKERDAARILDYLRRKGDATCDEAEQALAMSHQTTSARFSDLKYAGRIVPTERRRTRTGSWAQAWKAADQ